MLGRWRRPLVSDGNHVFSEYSRSDLCRTEKARKIIYKKPCRTETVYGNECGTVFRHSYVYKVQNGRSVSSGHNAYTPSQILLSASVAGPTLRVENHSGAIQLHLQIPGPKQDIASALSDWTSEGETLVRCVDPDRAEAAIFEVVAAVKPLSN